MMYSPEEMVHILRIRAKTEGLNIEEDALVELGDVEASIRKAFFVI